jgi:hypothetical protein
MSDFGFDPTALFQEAQQRQERMAMEADANVHSIHNLIDALDEEQLQTLAFLLRLVEDVKTNYLYIGVVYSKLASKFGQCLACGKKHEELEQELFGSFDEQ